METPGSEGPMGGRQGNKRGDNLMKSAQNRTYSTAAQETGAECQSSTISERIKQRKTTNWVSNRKQRRSVTVNEGGGGFALICSSYSRYEAFNPSQINIMSCFTAKDCRETSHKRLFQLKISTKIHKSCVN